MLKKKLVEDLKKAVEELLPEEGRVAYPTTDIVCDISKNPQFGDYSTNIALQLAKLKGAKDKQSPTEIANEIVSHLGNLSYLEKVEVAGGGFINFFIKDEELIKNAEDLDLLKKVGKSQKVLVEYGHVNPLKEIHIGHLRTFILGESLCRVFESLENQVFRANYQGDIGLHIAKAIWGIKELGLPTKNLNLEEKAKFLGQAYAKGNLKYDEDESIKKQIDQINISLYKKDPELKEVYELARAWSLEYFEPIYELLGIKYDRCFFESEVYEAGKKIVLENIGSPREAGAGGAGKVFLKNDGAVIFPGEKYGLHNRVFITSSGNPTYEAKEIGLAELEYDSFNYENSIHVVASEQEGYFQVLIKAIDLIFPHLRHKKHHLSYGVVNLKMGKMSSRSGNVVTIDDLYHIISENVREIVKENRLKIDQETIKKVALGAIKFSYLKYSPRPNIVFDIDRSVSLEGDSGPYVQYTYARIQSVLKNAKKGTEFGDIKLEKHERAILRQLMFFQEIVEQVAVTFHPNLITSYLLDLARLYNLFYQECRIIGSEKEEFRLKLSVEVGKVLKKGLNLLGIEAPERM